MSVPPKSPVAAHYADAGVDLDAAERLVGRIREVAGRASRPEVLAGVGPFSGSFRLQGYRDPVLVASADGVGTKLKISALLDRYEDAGRDIVNHSVNDVLASGARPLFFLDYLASDGVGDDVRLRIIAGIAEACAEAGCALLGGETADLPGIYIRGSFDVAGFLVGAAERDELVDGSRVRPGDALLGIPSNGLHTSGYSLARKLFGVGMDGDAAAERAALDTYQPALGTTLGEALAVPHRSYLDVIGPHLGRISGIAHITGGGLPGNVPRMLPKGVAARLHWGTWEVLPIFEMIRARGVDLAEMLHVFNLGLGMVIAVAPGDADPLLAAIDGAVRVGEVIGRAEGEPGFVLEGAP